MLVCHCPEESHIVFVCTVMQKQAPILLPLWIYGSYPLKTAVPLLKV